MSVPSITVLMPVYNGEKYLREAIDSILQQTFADFELLIINDGSTDKSEEIILSYSDSRISYVKSEKNIKLIATLNKGIELAQGKYIARMDADDVSLPHRLQIQFDFMEQNSGVAVCGSWFKVLGDGGKEVKYFSNHDEIMMKMLYQCHLCHPTVIMRKSILENFVVKFDARFLHAEDYEFFTRIGEKFKLANIQEVLLSYRHHEQSVSFQNKQTQEANSLIIKKRLFQNFGAVSNEAELNLYRAIAHQEYASTKKYLTNAQQLLEKIYLANKHSLVFEEAFFKNHVADFWFNVSYHSTSLGLIAFKTYRHSILSSFKRLGFFQWFKFLLKAIFRF